MDWVVDPRATRGDGGPAAAVGLLTDHLRRHAADARQVAEAEPGLAREVEAAYDAVDDELLHLHLDWTAPTPVLTLSRLARAAEHDATHADPPTGAPVPARLRAALRERSATELARRELTTVRRTRLTYAAGPPPVLDTTVDPDRQGAAAVAVALAAAHDAHPTATGPQAAAIAGALIATAGTGSDALSDAAAAAESFVRLHGALGSEAYVVAVEEDRVELAVGRCPFSAAHAGAASLCHVSSGLAGQLAARVHGEASVVLDETIIAGDPECHLQVRLRPATDRDDDGAATSDAETFFWPPRTSTPPSVPKLDLSVSLPRESVSVPVVRRLAGQALVAFGVHPDDVGDVQLAITEACGNVIDHAGATDTYDVKVELSSKRCTLTVIDQGGGFDATAVPERPDDDAEAGRGLALMRALVDNLAFRNEPQAGAVVHMVKSLRYDPAHPLHRR